MSSIIDGIDYGPLAQLIGTWTGNQGVDIAPDNQANKDRSKFTDEIVFAIAGAADNAEEQDLVALRYRHLVRRAENGLIFHDQIGHWIYEPATNSVMHSLTIPRAVCLLAGGTVEKSGEATTFRVEASADSKSFGIVQSPFMLEKAETKAFKMELTVNADELSYRQVTSLHIYNKDFEHVDASVLQRTRYDD